MPTISLFYGIIISMLYMDNKRTKHHTSTQAIKAKAR